MYLVNTHTGEKINCRITELFKSDLSFVRKHFDFDWRKEFDKYEVFKLTTVNDFIHGLISIQLQEDSLYLSLAKVADINYGSAKQFDRAAGTLFAFAAQIALENRDGYIHMLSKSKLIPYYEEKYGFIQIGNSQRMISNEKNSRNLVNLYL